MKAKLSNYFKGAAFAAALIFLTHTGMALAQGGAALVDPASKLYAAELGQSINGSVRISNPGATPLRLRIYLADWALDLAGQFTFADAGTQKRSASEWVSFPDATLDLAPGRTEQLPYTVDVPPDTQPGTYWTVLFAESEPTAPEPGQPSATVSVRVGHVIYVNVPELRSEGAIVGIFGDPPTTPDGSYVLIAQYANVGNAAHGVEGNFSLRNDSGDTVIEAKIERSVVLPESDRAFQVNIVGPLPAGNYTALVVLNYGDEDRDVAGSFDFYLEEPLTEQGTQTP